MKNCFQLETSTWKQQIEQDLDECDRYISSQIEATIEQLTKRLYPQLKKHVFHLAWSPSACLVETAIKPLTDVVCFKFAQMNKNITYPIDFIMVNNFNKD